MKTIIIYSSQTGFTKQYATWLAEDLGAELLTIAQAKKKSEEYFADADAIIYGGWTMGGRVVKSEWFKSHIPSWKDKKLAVFCVGASPNEFSGVEASLANILTEEEKKYAKAFYCQGGLAYDRMKFPYKQLMKAFSSMMRKKKDATQDEKDMAEMISKSYDIADKKYIQPVVDYIKA